MEGKPDWLSGFPVQIYCNRGDFYIVKAAGSVILYSGRLLPTGLNTKRFFAQREGMDTGRNPLERSFRDAAENQIFDGYRPFGCAGRRSWEARE